MMGRQATPGAGRDWVPAIPLALALMCLLGMAAIGYAASRKAGPYPVVTSQPAGAPAQEVQPPAPAAGASDAVQACAGPSAPSQPRPPAASENLTGGAGTVRASFTVVAPPGS